MGYELTLLESVKEVGRGVWQELEGPDDYPFLKYEWLDALESADCLGMERGWVTRHLVIKKKPASGPERLVAVAPAYIKLHSMGEFVFDQGWADFAQSRLGIPYYPKLVLSVPFTPATGPRVLLHRELDQSERAEVFDVLTGALPELTQKLGLSSVHILFPDEAQASELRERDWALRYGIQYQFHNRNYGGFDDFLCSFRSKRRAAIRRERRHLVDADIRIDVLGGETSGPSESALPRASTNGGALSEEDARLAHALYLTTVDKYVWGRRYLTRTFFERVFATMPEHVNFVVARGRGSSNEGGSSQVLGGAFNLVGRHALYGRYWGCFVDVPFLHFNVCLYHGVEQTIARRLSRFEPGAGGEHKESRGFRPTLTQSLHFLVNPTLDAAVRDFLARERDALTQHVAAAEPSVPDAGPRL